jgi:hypothetical protein
MSNAKRQGVALAGLLSMGWGAVSFVWDIPGRIDDARWWVRTLAMIHVHMLAWLPLIIGAALVLIAEGPILLARYRGKQDADPAEVPPASMNDTTDSEPQIVLVEAPHKMSEQGRIFITNIGPVDLLSTLQTMTNYQIQRHVEDYKGKWYALGAVVEDITPRLSGGVSVGIGTGKFMRWVTTNFDPKFKDQLVMLRPGDRIRFIGKIRSIDRNAVRLEECEPI